MVARSVVTTQPAVEPITLALARQHLELGASDTSHDDVLAQYIAAAREQWERDTGRALIERTYKLTTCELEEMRFDVRPVTAITSIKYYDAGGTQQTLSTSVYQLDTSTSTLRLAYNQTWPSYQDRWDAVEIIYTAGEHEDETTVPAIDVQAMLLYVGYLFRGNRGDDDRSDDLRAYEALVIRHMRSTYP